MQTTSPHKLNAATQANPHEKDIASVLAKWSEASAKAREAIFDTMQLQRDIEKLAPAKANKHFARDVATQISAILALNLNSMLVDLAESEGDSAEFIEDGNSPTTEPEFISEEEDAASLSDYEKNRRCLHSTIMGTIAAFRET